MNEEAEGVRLGPGTEHEQVTERELPDGRNVRIEYSKRVFLDQWGKHNVVEHTKIPRTRCGHSPIGISDIGQCHSCKEQSCAKCVVRCRSCKERFCDASSCTVEVRENVYECHECATEREIRQPRQNYLETLRVVYGR